ncbi:hypothetical protein CSA37_01635 [Candidatus Fermentibacteria bacterium]|nr:MAG: hypothetical protein CSA37_01635 [Candidatus Fermentibacteria bacterium]
MGDKVTVHLTVLAAVMIAAINTIACHGRSKSNGVIEKTLVVVDSLGVEYGVENQVYGDIAAAMQINDTTIVILDKGYQELRIYDHNGSYLYTKNYNGNGPYEYQCAANLALRANGIGVFESIRPPKFIEMDMMLEPENAVTIGESRTLNEPWYVNSETIAGYIRYYTMVNDIPTMGIEICTWNAATGERLETIYERGQELLSLDNGYGLFVDMEACVAASSNGRVYVAENKEANEVTVYSLDGNAIDTLRIENEAGFRTPEEVEQELIWRKLRDGDLGDWNPNNESLGVIDIQIQDSLGYVWICSGSYCQPYFTVYNMNGDIEFTCVCEGLPSNELMGFGITDSGYLAYTISPVTYPRVYLLEMEQ